MSADGDDPFSHGARHAKETEFSFSNMTGESLTRLPGEIAGQPFELHGLDDCEVLLLDHSGPVRIDSLKDSKVFIGACSAAVLISRCINCDFTVAARELRAISVEDSRFFVYCATPPLIEQATGVLIAPFNGAYPQQHEHLAEAGLDPALDDWAAVQAPTGGVQFMSPEAFAGFGERWEPLGECDAAIPLTFPAPVAPSHSYGSPPAANHTPAFEAPYYPPGAASPPEAAILHASYGSGGGSFAEPNREQSRGSRSGSFVEQNADSVRSVRAASGGDRVFAEHFEEADEMREPEGPYEAWLSKWEASLRAKREAEAAVVGENKARAEVELDRFYDRFTDAKAHRQERNRELEALTHERLAYQETIENPFERVVELIGGGKDEGGEATDRSRFRSILFKLKKDGWPCRGGMERSSSAGSDM